MAEPKNDSMSYELWANDKFNVTNEINCVPEYSPHGASRTRWGNVGL